MKPQRPDIEFTSDAEVTTVDPKPWFLVVAESEAAQRRMSKAPPSRSARPPKSRR